MKQRMLHVDKFFLSKVLTCDMQHSCNYLGVIKMLTKALLFSLSRYVITPTPQARIHRVTIRVAVHCLNLLSVMRNQVLNFF